MITEAIKEINKDRESDDHICHPYLAISSIPSSFIIIITIVILHIILTIITITSSSSL